MRRRAIRAALAGVGLAAARALAPRLHARLMAGCERMFEQMPETLPPKRMLRGIEEIRVNSARTLALLEAHEQAREAERASRPRRQVQRTAPLGRNKEAKLGAVGASVPGSET